MTTSAKPPRPRILVVDDLEPVRTALARSLRHAFSAATAPSARAALKLLAEEPFDALVTDFDMPPGPDGIWLVMECMRRHPNVRRFLATGNQLAHFEPYVTSGVIEAWFQKPIVAASFIARFRERSP